MHKGHDALLTKLTDWHTRAIEELRGSYDEARDAYEYMRGNQLSDDIRAELESRGQPISWENAYQEIDSKIEGLTLLARQEVKAVPRRTLDHKKTQMINDVLKSFRDSTEWATNKKLSNRDLRLTGITTVEVKMKITDDDEVDAFGEPMRELEYIYRPTLEMIFDPYSKRPDYSDARFATHSRLVLIEEVEHLVKNRLSSSYDGLVRLNRTYYKDSNKRVRFCLWVEGEVLQDIPSPFEKLDRFPFAIRKLYEGSPFKEFYGMYRSIRPLQDKLNFIMLRISNMLGSRRMIIESDAVEDIEEFVDENSKDDAVLVVRPNALKNKKWADITSTNNIPALMQIAQDTRAKIKTIIGVNDELLGLATARLSGDAMEQRKEAGLAGLQNFLDVSGELDKDKTEIAIPIIQEHFTAEQLIVMRDDFSGEPKETKINAYHRTKDGRLIYEGDFGKRRPKRDSLIDTGRFSLFLTRSAVNRGATGERNRGWSEIMKVLQVTRPEAVPAILPSMLRDIDSPVAEEVQNILAKLDEMAQANQQGNQQQMEAMQIELKSHVAKIAELESKANLNNAKASEIAKDLNVNKGVEDVQK
jgi:hypothetical protein